MARYDEYKSSEHDYFGQIPSHWEVKPIKILGTFRKGITFTKADLVDEGNAVVSYGQIHSKLNNSVCLRDELIRYIPNSIIEGQSLSLAKPGDFVFADTSENLEGCGNHVLIDKREYSIYAGYHTIILKRILDTNNNRYLSYLFRTGLWRSQLRDSVSGVKVYSITQQILSSAKIILPQSVEQEAIANYLDKKCGAIDKVIATQNRRIALLEELKQSIITEVVTRGLNPDAPLRDSGIKWISKIPEHWEAKRLRFICEFRNGYTPSKTNPDFWTDGIIPWYRMEDIRDSGRHLNEAKQYITEDAVKGGGLFDAGSFILATTATIGEHAVLIVDSLANQQFTNLKIRKSLTDSVRRDYFFYYLYVIDDYCKSTTNTATFASVNMDDLKNFPVIIPPVKEQEFIVKYIEYKLKSIENTISKAYREVELLKELKQSIITEAVTGKIKVC